MNTKNDAKILELQNLIESKKNELNTCEKFAPKTSCMFELFNFKCNINVLNYEELKTFVVFLHSLESSKNSLMFQSLKINGFDLTEWLDDSVNRLHSLEHKIQKNKLSDYQIQLDKLLSSETKTKLEINNIEKALKEF